MSYNSIVVLGPTASGKTRLAVAIARNIGAEIISADSRQVYRGLDIGSGKDLREYTVDDVTVPYHLIDAADVSREYSVFDFQRDAYKAFMDITARHVIPLIAGGTGMYLDSLIRGYDFVETPVNHELRENLNGLPIEELARRLFALKNGVLHNSTDTAARDRLIRAIEIETFSQSEEGKRARATVRRPDIQPLMLGVFFPRDVLRKRITARLRERFEAGMIDEVRGLHEKGVSWERLEQLGLEYKFTARFLQSKSVLHGRVTAEDELFDALNTAIAQFAKRQETWFRGMERKGAVIHRVRIESGSASIESAMEIIEGADQCRIPSYSPP
ncbi:MAG: tRNA (adenosine(37)-N6)-dimethylallyltransferase MiaA [Treponemataceae bacterium]|nr:MAG: tRNA (adenosine(37)-N6)-dimethylallyltransferase MiaA [Treponemataceae bacterium]